MSKILIVGDPHLGRNIRKAVKETQDDSWIALERVTSYMREYDPDVVILTGDVFNSPKVSGTELKKFQRFMHVQCPVFTIMGNHDAGETDIADSLGCKSIHKELSTVGGLTFYGLNYMSATELKNELPNVPACDFLVLHQGFEHLLGFADAFELTLADVPPQVKNVICGHIHIFDQRPLPHGGIFLSPGSLHPVTFKETDDRYIVLWDTDTNKQTALPVRVRRTRSFNPATILELATCIKELDNLEVNEPAPLIRIKYLPELADEVFKCMQTHPQCLWVPVPVTEKCADLVETINAGEVFSLNNALPLYVDPKEDRPLFDFLHELVLGDSTRALTEQLELLGDELDEKKAEAEEFTLE